MPLPLLQTLLRCIEPSMSKLAEKNLITISTLPLSNAAEIDHNLNAGIFVTLAKWITAVGKTFLEITTILNWCTCSRLIRLMTNSYYTTVNRNLADFCLVSIVSLMWAYWKHTLGPNCSLPPPLCHCRITSFIGQSNC